ncbi:MAG: ribonuclease P protein component [bacterium]|nr:ribonuclease P protein component [bacterium]
MLLKTNRADKKTIDTIFSVGKFINSQTLTFKYILTDARAVRVSFIAPKSTAKLAVKRNALRRLGYNILKKELYRLPRGLAGVFIFKKNEDDAEKLKREIETIIGKIAIAAN